MNGHEPSFAGTDGVAAQFGQQTDALVAIEDFVQRIEPLLRDKLACLCQDVPGVPVSAAPAGTPLDAAPERLQDGPRAGAAGFDQGPTGFEAEGRQLGSAVSSELEAVSCGP